MIEQYNFFVSDCFTESTHENSKIQNVLLCGNSSRNGYEIPPSAFVDEAHAKRLYTGKNVFLDHPDREGRRSVRDLAGVISEVYFRNGKPYGTIDTQDCPGGPTLQLLTKRSDGTKAGGLGMSHVARYEWENPKTRKRVKKITEVASVDAVVNAATTNTFYEHQGKIAMDELTAELKTVRQDRDTAQESLKTANARVTELEGLLKKAQEDLAAEKAKADTLATESAALKAKVDEYQTKEALVTRKQAILDALKSEGLNADDKIQVSEVFMESLMAIAEDTKRNAAIKDRASVIKESTKANPSTRERQTPSGNAKTYADHLAALKGATK